MADPFTHDPRRIAQFTRDAAAMYKQRSHEIYELAESPYNYTGIPAGALRTVDTPIIEAEQMAEAKRILAEHRPNMYYDVTKRHADFLLGCFESFRERVEQAGVVTPGTAAAALARAEAEVKAAATLPDGHPEKVAAQEHVAQAKRLVDEASFIQDEIVAIAKMMPCKTNNGI